MRRRLDLAAALVHRPPVLFLDEPTTGLDPHGRSDLWEVIEELVADGTTVLLTTQYLEEADRLADDIVVIDDGRVIAEGTPTELKAQLGSTDRRGRSRRRRLGGAGRRGRRAARGALRRSVDGRTVRARGGRRCPHRSSRSCACSIRTASRPVELTVREPTLDDVFLSLTGDTPRSRRDPRPTTNRIPNRSRTCLRPEVPHDDDRTSPPTPPPLPSRSTARVAWPRWPTRSRSTGATCSRCVRTPQLLVFSHDPAGHLRADVPLRVRRRDQRARHRLRRLPDARHLRADRRVRRDADRHRPGRGPAQGPDRAVPLAADGPLRGAGRPHDRRPRAATCSSSCSCAPSASSSGAQVHTDVVLVRRRRCC